MSVAQIILLLITVLLLGGILAHFLLERRHRAKAGSPNQQQVVGPIFREDERYWLGGLLYYNPDDPDLFVPRRFGIGLTINFAHPRAKWFIFGTLGLMLVLTTLSVLSKHGG